MDNIVENAINIFTDGSSFSAPRKGGMGIRFVIINDEGYEEIFDLEPLGHKGASNQQMELQACVEALAYLMSNYSPIDIDEYQKIIVNSDSMYVVENFSKAKFEWPRTKWMTRNGTPVANAEIWKDLVKKSMKLEKRIEFRWVKGHKSSVGNKAADKIARRSAQGVLRPPLSIVSVRRKITKQSLVRESVQLSGQRLSVRIIVVERLRIQRCWKYKYEVMSKASPFYGCVDVAFSDLPLRDGHIYFVLMNDDTRNPRILKKYRELEVKRKPAKDDSSR